MKIIKKGKVEEKVWTRTCSNCKTEFEYTQSDVDSDREGSYVVCPLEGCGAFIAHGGLGSGFGGSVFENH